MAASLYKLGIGQLSDALAKLNLQTQKEPAEQQLEKDLIRYLYVSIGTYVVYICKLNISFLLFPTTYCARSFAFRII